MSERILRLPEVKALSGLSRSTIYLRMAEGLFPRAIALGPRMIGFRESEVAAVNAARIRGVGAKKFALLSHRCSQPDKAQLEVPPCDAKRRRNAVNRTKAGDRQSLSSRDRFKRWPRTAAR